MIDRKLTAIIIFLNEGFEVENTLKSVIDHSNGDVEIMLINDASDDGFDYKEITQRYNVLYFENKERIGIAASRDLGVKHCQTPYFLLLDAHMRFYNSLWVNRIIAELENDKRVLLCCQTKSLRMENGILIENKNRKQGYGACVELYQGKEMTNSVWVNIELTETVNMRTIPVACVLGASYSCSKEYWKYLKGLEGLKFYGSDEAYISMKVWMEGGQCKLLKDVIVGHLYRTSPNYETAMKYRIYNRLLIMKLFFPRELKKELLSQIRLYYFSFLSESLLMLHEKNEEIQRLKEYYSHIFKNDFNFFEKLNYVYYPKKKPTVDLKNVLDDIVQNVIKQPVVDIGILNGRMGIVIFLFHYARYTNNDSCQKMADEMLINLLQDIKSDTFYGFFTGLSGIGWGIEYLYQWGFLEGDTNEMLAEIDRKIMEINPKYINNLNKDYGFGGIVLYLLARLYTIEKESKSSPFDENYLDSVYYRINSVITQRDISCDSIDIFLEFLNYYEGRESIDKPEIFDVWCLLNPQDIPLSELDSGINGASGIGIKLILDSLKERL